MTRASGMRKLKKKQGSSQPSGQAQGSSLIGASNTNAAGISAQQPSSGTFTFGATQTPGAQGQGQTQPQGSSLFGAPANQPGTTGGLFGSTNQQQPAVSGSLFGNTATNNTAQPGPQQGGLFGSTSNNAQPGLFGNTNTSTTQNTGSMFGAKPMGGLFGSTTQPSTGTTGSLFGQQPAQQQATGSAFGTGSLFGGQNQQNQQNQPAAGSSLFGSTNQQTQNQGQNSLFGSTPGGLFGTTTQPQSQNSLFASTSQPLGQSMVASSAGGSSAAPKQEPDIETRMMAVKNAWDVNSPDCRFKYFFYNMVDHGTAGQYGRPAAANDDAKWAKAQRDNPDPNSVVPVVATGWADIKKRTQMQEQIASVHQQRIKEISEALSYLTRQTSLSSSIRLAALQTQLSSLMHRLIHLTSQMPQFIPILQSTAFRPEEAAVQGQLEGIKAEMDGKTKSKRMNGGTVGLNGSNGVDGESRLRKGEGRMIGQVNELWGQLEEIRRRRRNIAGDKGEGWLGDERALAEIAEILSGQQLALQKLSDLLNNALFDADVMKQGLATLNLER